MHLIGGEQNYQRTECADFNANISWAQQYFHANHIKQFRDLNARENFAHFGTKFLQPLHWTDGNKSLFPVHFSHPIYSQFHVNQSKNIYQSLCIFTTQKELTFVLNYGIPIEVCISYLKMYKSQGVMEEVYCFHKKLLGIQRCGLSQAL